MRTLFDDPEDEVDESSPSGASSGSSAGTPLAERLRPSRLDDMVGQEQVVGADGFLRRAVAEDRVPSMILWGPPGCGKTTLAQIVAGETACRFVPFSAVTSGIKDVKQVMADAARLRKATQQRTLLFVDEIHRFNRAQQDAFLPYVERGDIVLVGATTENPSFEVNGALLSRCRVVILEPIASEVLQALLARALKDPAGLDDPGVELLDEAYEAITSLASGDARKALNLLELVVIDAREEIIDASAVERVAQRKILLYDKSGEEHFNLISALHKSLRESDPDAALYWLARMLEAGEEPLYVVRRLVRFASEDVGLADPRALGRTLDAWNTYERLGSPEGDLAIAQATLYLAFAPKSNAVYRAWGDARKTVRERPADPVPMAIRNAPTRLMKEVGYGSGHVYAHDTEERIGGMECLPEALRGTRFYHPTDQGIERRLQERLAELDELRRRARKR